jgi:hypothetical protein
MSPNTEIPTMSRNRTSSQLYRSLSDFAAISLAADAREKNRHRGLELESDTRIPSLLLACSVSEWCCCGMGWLAISEPWFLDETTRAQSDVECTAKCPTHDINFLLDAAIEVAFCRLRSHFTKAKNKSALTLSSGLGKPGKAVGQRLSFLTVAHCTYLQANVRKGVRYDFAMSPLVPEKHISRTLARNAKFFSSAWMPLRLQMPENGLIKINEAQKMRDRILRNFLAHLKSHVQATAA